MYDAGTGLVFLRARYYSAGDGRFLSRDQWDGDERTPMSYNAWLYGYANSLRYIDPTGFYNRQAAVEYALKYNDMASKDPHLGILDSNCVNFASATLWEGGVRDKREKDSSYLTRDIWSKENLSSQEKINEAYVYNYGGIYPWSFTEGLLNFLKENANVTIKELNYILPIPNYSGMFRYGKAGGNLMSRWENWLQDSRQEIKEGDIVFYDILGYQTSKYTEWDHAAVIVGWGTPTFNTTSEVVNGNPSYLVFQMVPQLQEVLDPDGACYSTLLRPMVVERSGSIQYQGSRSIENTSKMIRKIKIIHIND